jgi:hypothetical protein
MHHVILLAFGHRLVVLGSSARSRGDFTFERGCTSRGLGKLALARQHDDHRGQFSTPAPIGHVDATVYEIGDRTAS